MYVYTIMNLKKSIIYFCFFCVLLVSAQENTTNASLQYFDVKVVVEAKNTGKRIKDAEVFVEGRYYRYRLIDNHYLVKAKVGDELRISHSDFETVYYRIQSDEEIKILVEDYTPLNDENEELYSSKRKRVETSDLYHQFLDSAKFYKKKDIDKSLTFIEKILRTKPSTSKNAKTYKTLADIYLFWKQYDLAIYNYKLSNQIQPNATTKILLAQAAFLANNLEYSQQILENIVNDKLTDFEKIDVLEGLGDVNLKTKKYVKSKNYYREALQIAKKNGITSKITDLNSKTADVFVAEGNVAKAKATFKSVLNFAAKESVNRVLKEEEKVADFLNQNQRYDDEIKLRKESLKKATTQKSSKNVSVHKDSITSQKINYKIGNAYISKEAYKEAIPYLKQSIKDADEKEDIVVEKVATRKLSEVYAAVGDYDSALKSYQDYVKLVDKSYIKKEQEIYQATRLSKTIANNQNRIASLEKDKELAESRINLAYTNQKLSEQSSQKQLTIIYSLFGGFVLMSLLVYFMFKNIKQQKIANNLLALKSMRSQMNPHFIFNALNSVNSFIAENDERSANRYLSEFSLLMRSVLENSDEDFIPLTKEVELIELYVKLEHNRFKDKFEYSIIVDKTIQLEEFSIPPMLLQPYIENAIWHGLRYKKEKGRLNISIFQKDKETLSILIEDDGIGRKKSQEIKTKNQLKQKSKGMSTIQNRIAILNNMYKERITVNVSNLFENEEGTKVALLLKKN